MSTPRSFVLTDSVLADAAGLLADPSKEVLTQMVTDSAIVTHAYGNRRYKGYVFQVNGDQVVSMARYATGVEQKKTACTVCGGDGKLIVYDECPYCFGETCDKCNHEGTIRKEVRCKCHSLRK